MKALLFFLTFTLLISYAEAAGIAVSPEKIAFSAEEGNYDEKSMLIYNTNSEDTSFTVNALHYGNFFEIVPKEGIIKGKEKEKIRIRLKPGMKKGLYEDVIVAKFSHGSSAVSIDVGAGVKATITIKAPIIPEKDFIGPFITLSIVAVGLLIYRAMA